MHQCHIELVKYHHRKQVRCLDCCQLCALVLSFYHSAVAVQANSLNSNKDDVSLVPNWGFSDPFICDDERGSPLVDSIREFICKDVCVVNIHFWSQFLFI